MIENRVTSTICLVLLFAAGLVAPQSVAASESARPPVVDLAVEDYRFASVVADRVGEPPTGYWLFRPERPRDPNDDRPLALVVFLHGFTALDPVVYRGWIDHLARRGAAVVYPDYQVADPLGTATTRMLPNAAAAIRQAVSALRSDGQAVDLDQMALVGHSLGGVLAVALAARAAAEGLPPTSAVMAVNPGGCRGCGGPGTERGVPLPDLAGIPMSARVAIVVSEDDDFVGDDAARSIWDRLESLPPAHRVFVELRSDRHGEPPLVADHNVAHTESPWGADRTDALDIHGLWRPFDRLAACAVDPACVASVADDPVWRDLGTWSDGVPVRAPRVEDGDSRGANAP